MVKKLSQVNLFLPVEIILTLLLTYTLILILRNVLLTESDFIYPSKFYPWILVIPQIFMLLYSIKFLNNLRKLFKNVRLKNYLFAILLLLINLSFYLYYAEIVFFFSLEIMYLPNISKYILGEGLFIFINLFAICVWVPVIEEIFFRGVILRKLTESHGNFISIILSSFLFCVVHGDVGLLIPVFFSSISISILFVISKSLFPCIMLHSFQNFFVCIVATFA